MDPILIPTRPHQALVSGQKYHLLLSHELDPASKAFYALEASHGSYLILDNSAHEKSEGEDLSVLLRQADEIRASEIVVPDVLFDRSMTLYRVRTSLTSLARSCDEGHYHRVVPRLMIVPQARQKDELKECLWELVSFIDGLRRRSGAARSWQFTIGVSKDYNDVWGDRDFLLNFLALEVVPASKMIDAEIHLLGWPKPLPVLREIAQSFAYTVRSTDSARPFTFAMFGIDLAESLDIEYPKRPKGFFERAVPKEWVGVLASNISVYRNLCRVEPVRGRFVHITDREAR